MNFEMLAFEESGIPEYRRSSEQRRKPNTRYSPQHTVYMYTYMYYNMTFLHTNDPAVVWNPSEHTSINQYSECLRHSRGTKIVTD